MYYSTLQIIVHSTNCYTSIKCLIYPFKDAVYTVLFKSRSYRAVTFLISALKTNHILIIVQRDAT